MLISVVIPTYNRLPILRKCLDALENQVLNNEIHNFEIVIVRALAARPKLLLADEPTSALDSSTGREIVDLLKKLAAEQSCSVLMVTHDPRILDVADRLLRMEDGQLLPSV